METLQKEIWDKNKQLVLLKKQLASEEIENYVFNTPEGAKSLSDFFKEKDELILIHNMGKHCPYCTLWGDGFNGVLSHLENRAGFVVISPDEANVQREFAKNRGWKFEMASAKGTNFIKDMGFELEDGKYMPGVSMFYKDEQGLITRTGKDVFGPGDNYSSPWHLFDLLKLGVNKWQPKFQY
ncbi:MAG: DUF899 family protein [Candidatus Hodarchaeales archaeon]|jgi:predicted dithiol-disulfide oxidoreductase (DUF899 family)